MNKFIAFTLFALVAGVSCNPLGENQETELLLGAEKFFSGFCMQQGQKIRDDLNEFTRATSSEIAKIFFGSVNEITDDVITVQKDAVKELSDQLANPSNEIVNDAALSEDQIAKLIREGKEAIKAKDSIAGVLPATKATFAAMMSTANSAVFTRLAKARSLVSGLNLFNGFKEACKKVANYEEDMAAALEQEKQRISAENGDNAEVLKFIETVSVSNLNCFTTKNIVRLHGFCDIVQAGHRHFFKMLGMSSPLEKLEQ